MQYIFVMYFKALLGNADKKAGSNAKAQNVNIYALY